MRLKDNILFEQNNQKDHSVMGGFIFIFIIKEGPTTIFNVLAYYDFFYLKGREVNSLF